MDGSSHTLAEGLRSRRHDLVAQARLGHGPPVGFGHAPGPRGGSQDLGRAVLLDAEIGQLARLLENRVIDPERPSERTTSRDALAIAKAMKAVLTGFGIREPFMADVSGLADLARQSCLALTALASNG
jgi:hypothetical protein